MKRIALTLVLLAFSVVTNAGTDYQCLTNCTSKGYVYQLCNERCSYDNNRDSARTRLDPSIPMGIKSPQLIQQEVLQNQLLQLQIQVQQQKQQCIENCTSQGNDYGLCRQQC